MNLGVQYYRPPFPEAKHWEDDFKRIKDSGLNTVQLWVIWAWVEAKPGHFDFDDYDRLVDLAGKNELGVVLSAIAEVQPYWIHREVPGSEMIDHRGLKVVSSNRQECHFGITPGGCTDNPGVWERMAEFLTRLANRYRPVPHLRGWDAWNELRWNVQADGLVCHCEHTLAAFRKHLDEKYGGIDGLNRAWMRRYNHFDEVLPGKCPSRPYTEMMAFEHFITWRANQHAIRRYKIIKGIDPKRPVTVHAASPSPLWEGYPEDQALSRGNDWAYADHLDGVGCSSFPKWGNMDDADFGMRVEFVKSAAREKAVWLSEVQGGRSSIGFDMFEDVDALSQQRWVWNGIACGADTILFWCWRDEVFGQESAGFGIAGDDGLADERLEAMKITGGLLEKHAGLLAAYKPDKPRVGVLFSPQSYYLSWAQEGHAGRCSQALQGYCRGLVRKSIPYAVVEEEHLETLAGLNILFLPRVIVTGERLENELIRFVQNGGTLVCESECGAFSPEGLYRYPQDRFTARAAGIREVGRRRPAGDTIAVTLGDRTLNLHLSQWLTPWQWDKGKILSSGDHGSLMSEVALGKGRLMLCGTYLGDAYLKYRGPDFEDFVEILSRTSGFEPDVEIASPAPGPESFVYVKSGESNGKRMFFVFFPKGCAETTLRFRRGLIRSSRLYDLIGDRAVAVTDSKAGQECLLKASPWNFSVLMEL